MAHGVGIVRLTVYACFILLLGMSPCCARTLYRETESSLDNLLMSDLPIESYFDELRPPYGDRDDDMTLQVQSLAVLARIYATNMLDERSNRPKVKFQWLKKQTMKRQSRRTGEVIVAFLS